MKIVGGGLLSKDIRDESTNDFIVSNLGMLNADAHVAGLSELLWVKRHPESPLRKEVICANVQPIGASQHQFKAFKDVFVEGTGTVRVIGVFDWSLNEFSPRAAAELAAR